MNDMFNQNKFTLYLQPSFREQLNKAAEATGESRAEIIKRGLKMICEKLEQEKKELEVA